MLPLMLGTVSHILPSKLSQMVLHIPINELFDEKFLPSSNQKLLRAMDVPYSVFVKYHGHLWHNLRDICAQ